MLIKLISIAGWRSFAPESKAELGNLGQVNLVIGPNNVGKSNVGRLIVRLRDILRTVGCQHNRPWEDGGAFFTPLSYRFEAIEIDHWLRGTALIDAELEIMAEALEAPQAFPSWLARDNTIRFRVSISRDNQQGTLAITPLTPDGQPVVKREGNAYWLLQEDGQYTDQVVSGSAHWYRGLALAAGLCLATRVFEVQPLRDPNRTNSTISDGSTDGGGIVKKLLDSQNDVNRQAFWTNCKGDIEKWLAMLLGDSDIRIEVNAAGFWIETRRGGHPLRCALPELGAGVSEMVMLLAYLRLCPDHKLFVILDEPEAHLHPGAVVELVKIVTANLPNHQLLITTHSTALIDAVTPQWRTFRALRSDQGGTCLEPLETTQAELGLLVDLGIRPSQMFLARVVLWVEGPSDIHYWTALLKEANEKLVDGRDFAFVMYGGASGAHLDLDDEDDEVAHLVRVLKVAHRAVIICDRDRDSDQDDRQFIVRLIKAAEKLPNHVYVGKSVGREIENDVMPEVLLEVLDEFLPRRFNKPKLVPIKYETYTIEPDIAFNVAVAKAARDDQGNPLAKNLLERIESRLDGDKHAIAERVRSMGSTTSVFRNSAIENAKSIVRWMGAD